MLKIGLFREAYLIWHSPCLIALGKQIQFVREQYRLNHLTSATPGNYGYGGNAHKAAENTKFKGYVANVGAAYAANQNTEQQFVVRNNMQANMITQMQQQHAQMVASMNQAPVVPPVQYQQQWQQPKQLYNPRRLNCNRR